MSTLPASSAPFRATRVAPELGSVDLATGDQALIAQFCGAGTAYYTDRFLRIFKRGVHRGGVNVAALLAGCTWGAARGLWWLFWIGLTVELAGLILIVHGLMSNGDSWLSRWGAPAGLTLLGVERLAFGALATRALYWRYNRWRADRMFDAHVSARRIVWSLVLIASIVPLVIYRTTRVAPTARDCRGVWTSLMSNGSDLGVQRLFDCTLIGGVPTDLGIFTHVARAINDAITYCTVNFQTFFDGIAWSIRITLRGLEVLFVGVPWPVTALLFVLIAWRVAGRGIALFVALALTYLALFNFWANAMSTLSLVCAAVFMSIIVGVPLGILCAKSARVFRVIRPVLDVMQTLPAFVYLIPAIAFFSIGKTPGVIATFIYASPPVIRLTTLGIQQVPHSVREATLAFGATPFQLLRKVELPLALWSIMAGINQTIMLSISMSVTAALIGAGGLGFDVLFALQNVEPGRGVLAGLAIALCAMMIDRTIQGGRRKTPASE